MRKRGYRNIGKRKGERNRKGEKLWMKMVEGESTDTVGKKRENRRKDREKGD